MNKEKRIELLSTAGKALLELVPFVGGSVSSVIGNYQAERKHQRLVDFFESLKTDLDKVKESVKAVGKKIEMVNRLKQDTRNQY